MKIPRVIVADPKSKCVSGHPARKLLLVVKVECPVCGQLGDDRRTDFAFTEAHLRVHGHADLLTDPSTKSSETL